MIAWRVSGTLEYSPAFAIRARTGRPFAFLLETNVKGVRLIDGAIAVVRYSGYHTTSYRALLLVPILALLLPACHWWPVPVSASLQQHTATKHRTPTDSVSKEHPVSFLVGERLAYHVSWSVFSNAASLELSVPERRDLFGHEAWHFRGVAHTLNSVRTLFPIDDQFDSYTDVGTLDCLQFETHLSEMGKSTSQVLHLATSNQATQLPPPIVIVPPDTHDALGAVYSLRDVDWRAISDFRAPVYDGHDLYEIRASRESSDEPVKVAAGAFSTSRISIRVFQNQKEDSAVHYVLWIASDAARTPVLMEANLPFGTIRAELTSATQ
jgi:Protein of unknown function (DUF3108)